MVLQVDEEEGADGWDGGAQSTGVGMGEAEAVEGGVVRRGHLGVDGVVEADGEVAGAGAGGVREPHDGAGGGRVGAFGDVVVGAAGVDEKGEVAEGGTLEGCLSVDNGK